MLKRRGDYGRVGTKSLLLQRWRKYVAGLLRSIITQAVFSRTCFWAGDTFTPKLKVKNAKGEDVSIQTFLQTAFLDMWELVTKTLGDLEGVIGFEVGSYYHVMSRTETLIIVDHE